MNVTWRCCGRCCCKDIPGRGQTPPRGPPRDPCLHRPSSMRLLLPGPSRLAPFGNSSVPQRFHPDRFCGLDGPVVHAPRPLDTRTHRERVDPRSDRTRDQPSSASSLPRSWMTLSGASPSRTPSAVLRWMPCGRGKPPQRNRSRPSPAPVPTADASGGPPFGRRSVVGQRPHRTTRSHPLVSPGRIPRPPRQVPGRPVGP